MKTSHFKIIGLRPTSPHIEDFEVCEKAQNIHKALVGIDKWLNVYEGYKVSGDYSCIQLSSLKQRLDYSLYDTDYLKVTVGANETVDNNKLSIQVPEYADGNYAKLIIWDGLLSMNPAQNTALIIQ